MARLFTGVEWYMKKILVVDDNTINLKLADKILKEVPDYKPIMVPSGARALQFLTKNVPSMILLDIMMPDMDGFETLAEIRKNPALDDVPVLFLTADTETETIEKAKSAGAVDLLTKPFKKDVLLDLVEKYMPEGE